MDNLWKKEEKKDNYPCGIIIVPLLNPIVPLEPQEEYKKPETYQNDKKPREKDG